MPAIASKKRKRIKVWDYLATEYRDRFFVQDPDGNRIEVYGRKNPEGVENVHAVRREAAPAGVRLGTRNGSTNDWESVHSRNGGSEPSGLPGPADGGRQTTPRTEI